MMAGLATPRNPPPDDDGAGRVGLLTSMAESLSGSGDIAARVATALRIVTLCLPAAGACVLRFAPDGSDGLQIASVGAVASDATSVVAHPGHIKGGVDFVDGGAGQPQHIACVLDFGPRGLGVLLVNPGPEHVSLDREARTFLRAAARTLSMGIANALMAGDLFDQERVRRDMELASDVQREFLPHCAVSDDSPIHGLNRPARQLSGDFFDFMWTPEGHVSFTLGDVSGKGLNAALLMAKAASLFRYIAKQHADPADVLRLINREVHETATRGMFVTMVAGVYDPASGRTVLANAGHEPPLLRGIDRSYKTFPAEAPPIGVMPDLDVASQTIDLNGGELYVFSDGLTEFDFDGGECLGVDGLVQLVEASAVEPLPYRLHTLLDELDRHGWRAHDDLTVLTIDSSWIPRHG